MLSNHQKKYAIGTSFLGASMGGDLLAEFQRSGLL